MKTFLIASVVLIVALAGFYFWYWNPASVSVSVSNTPTTTALPSTTAETSCDLIARDTILAYTRPNKQSPTFGYVTVADQLVVGGVTADGWVGFDPASAQAPNVGPFRLRWIDPDADFALEGDCESVPEMPSLPPLTCFTMAQTDIPIYSTKSNTSSVVATMHVGDYVKVAGKSDTSTNAWNKVDLNTGSLNVNKSGWIRAQDVNYNGQECQSLPTVS